MLDGIRRAVGARRPSTVEPTAGELIYAVGDVHGRYDLLKQLLGLIVEDCLARDPGRRPLLIFCGNYVDRGPDSAAVLEALIWLQHHGDIQARFLKGNHEAALMRYIDNPTDCADWLRLGGGETLRSYDVVLVPDDPESCVRARDLLLRRMPSSHLHFLERLELMLVVGHYAFVHAGIKPGVKLRSQSEDDLLWIRKSFLDDDGPFEKIIVHGHGWTDGNPEILPHRIGLDTGAYATGVLTAVRLDGHEIGLVQAKADELTEADNGLKAGSTNSPGLYSPQS